MRNLQNVVSDVLAQIRANRRIREQIDYDENEGIYNIQLRLGVSAMDIELYEERGRILGGGVLRCVGFGQRFQAAFMDTLLNALELA
jgi:hypothetical protein